MENDTTFLINMLCHYLTNTFISVFKEHDSKKQIFHFNSILEMIFK